MTKFRITFDVNADVITNCFIESTKGCPKCDVGASHDDLAEDLQDEDGLHVVGLEVGDEDVLPEKFIS